MSDDEQRTSGGGVSLAALGAVFGLGASYCAYHMNHENRRVNMINDAPLVKPDDAKSFLANRTAPAFVRMEGFLDATQRIQTEYSDAPGLVRETHTTPKVVRAHVNSFGFLSINDDWLGTQLDRQEAPGGLFIRSSEGEGKVFIDAGDVRDPMMLPFFATGMGDFMSYCKYHPVGPQQDIRVALGTKALGAWTASVGMQLLGGVNSAIYMHSNLGSEVKEFVLPAGQKIWAAGHLKRGSDGESVLWEDGTLNTPYVVSTQPLDVVTQKMKANASWYKSAGIVQGVIAGCFGVGAIVKGF